MKELKLGGKTGMIALVDDEDHERCLTVCWSPKISRMKNGQISTIYVQGSKFWFLHRFILGITDSAIKVDHRNRNGLDNQKHNLRTGTHSQNLANRPKALKNTRRFKGAYPSGKRWFSIISFNNKNRFLGCFQTEEEAARAYDKAAFEQWGEFAWLNFPKITRAV